MGRTGIISSEAQNKRKRPLSGITEELSALEPISKNWKMA